MSVELPIAVNAAPSGQAASRTASAKGQAGATTDPKDADDAFSLALSNADGAPAEAASAQDEASSLKSKGKSKSETQAADGPAAAQAPVPVELPPVMPVDNALLLAQSALSGRDPQAAAAAASAAAATAAAAAAAGPAAALASAAAAASDASAASAVSGVSAIAGASGAPAASALAAASAASADGAGIGFLPIGRAVPRGPVPVQALVSDAGRGAAAGRNALADAHAKSTPGGADAAGAAQARGTPANPGDALASGAGAASGAASAAHVSTSSSMSSQAATQRLAAQDVAHAASAASAASAAAPTVVGTPVPTTDAAALQAMLGPDVFGRRSDRLDERTPGAADSLPGALPGSGLNAGASALMTPIDAASAGASLGQNDLSDRMLEQVSWWLSQKTQGAELKLDVAGGQTVSVSVTVQGNEAHVAFRSDQPEVRQMLNQAMPQLKELLGSEGLMLSGSSVGAQSDGSNQAAAQQAARQWQDTLGMGSAPATAEAPRSAPPSMVRAPSGRSLDLYV